MNRKLRDFVRVRAGNRCEYCRLRQEHYRLWHHQIEHVIPRKHRGSNDESNLALACVRCNLGKSSNLSGIDDDSDEVVTLFNPRTQDWFAHFAFEDARIIGITPTGRATVAVLNINEDERLQLRTELLFNGELD